MKTVILYKITNTEEHITIGYAEDPDVAKKIAKGRGFWGADASIYPETVRIFDSIEDFQKNA